VIEERSQSIINQLKQLYPDFIIGTAASAHQVEGNNENDWTLFENKIGTIKNNDKSGKACNHYELYKDDFRDLSELGFSAHRLSIEWSRIFPKIDVISQSAIEHYRQVLSELKRLGLQSFVTLHHFTSPIWFMELGGFEKTKNLIHWKKFVELICQELGNLIDVFNTINEPFVYASTGYLNGIHSPGKKSLIKYFYVSNNLMRAHFQAVEIIRKICKDKPVGLVKNLAVFKNRRRNPIDWIITKIFDLGYNKIPLNSLKRKKIPFGFSRIKEGDMGDFLGINYYLIMEIGLGLPYFMNFFISGDSNLTQMGWGVYPYGLAEVLLRAYKITSLPLYVTENGIATEDDKWRIEFILDHLDSMINAMNNKVDVRGYFYWSNIDNFEWSEGFKPKFGIIEVDYSTFSRTTKESGKLLGSIAKFLRS